MGERGKFEKNIFASYFELQSYALNDVSLKQLAFHYSQNPRIRTSASKNLQPKIWGFQVRKYSRKQFFSVILPEPLENDCFDTFPLIFTFPFHSMFIYLLFQLRTRPGNCRFLFAGFYCILKRSLSSHFGQLCFICGLLLPNVHLET